LDGISTQKQCLLIVKTLFFLVEANLYTQWNRYGTYCFVPAEDDIIAMPHTLYARATQTWQEHISFHAKIPDGL
jgi:hypothetical protein